MVKLNKKGFTLAELLIVVAVIAVLVAVAIPTFNNQLEKSRQGVDVSNLRGAFAAARIAQMDQKVGTQELDDSHLTWYYDPDTGNLVSSLEDGYRKGTSLKLVADTSGLNNVVKYSHNGDFEKAQTSQKIAVVFVKEDGVYVIQSISFKDDGSAPPPLVLTGVADTTTAITTNTSSAALAAGGAFEVAATNLKIGGTTLTAETAANYDWAVTVTEGSEYFAADSAPTYDATNKKITATIAGTDAVGSGGGTVEAKFTVELTEKTGTGENNFKKFTNALEFTVTINKAA